VSAGCRTWRSAGRCPPRRTPRTSICAAGWSRSCCCGTCTSRAPTGRPAPTTRLGKRPAGLGHPRHLVLERLVRKAGVPRRGGADWRSRVPVPPPPAGTPR
jgi:hypothetical protein